MSPQAQTSAQQEHAVLRFVEQFALILVESGIPRMPARVFAYVLADDAEQYTASELAAGLRVSPAAISGAVRYLVQGGLLGKEREPGERSDHYRVYDTDVWYAITSQRQGLMDRWVAFLEEGVKLLDQARPGGRRVRETLEFYRFMNAEIPRLLEKWRVHRAKLMADELGGNHQV